MPGIVNGIQVTDATEYNTETNPVVQRYSFFNDAGIMSPDLGASLFNGGFLPSNPYEMPVFSYGFHGPTLYVGVGMSNGGAAVQLLFVTSYEPGESIVLDGIGTFSGLPDYLFSSTPFQYVPGMGWHSDGYFQPGQTLRYERYTSLFAVPEPGTWVMLIAGFGIVGLANRRRRVAAA